MPSTIDEIYDALDTNADFEETGSVTKAKAFITAATRYLVLSPNSQSDQGSSLTINAAQIEALLQRARAFVAASSSSSASTSKVRFLSASEGFRR